jgi:ABC-type transporter MlaC component
MGQMEAALAQQTGVAMKLKPSQHPKFQEEWQKVLTQLNDQYGNALNQYKKQVERFLSGAR